MNPFLNKINVLALAFLMALPFGYSLAQNAVLEQPVTTQADSSQKVEKKVIRAALDIGSGATKLKVAEVNLTTNKIERVLAVENYTVQYQDALAESPDQMFSELVMQQGIDALLKAKAVATGLGAEKIIGVATASFRNGKNAEQFIDRIYKETGVKIYIIDQELEGILNFEAATEKVPFPAQDLIVWDIGGGSYQFTTMDKDGKIVVHRGVDASVPFKNHVITHIKRQDIREVKTPNPISSKELSLTEIRAREIAEKVDEVFREKIMNPETKIVGVGNIFAYNIHPIVCDLSPYNQEQLDTGLQKLVGKTDAQIGGGDYANVYITNPILVIGFMRSLGIDEVYIEDINNADGALLYSKFWETK